MTEDDSQVSKVVQRLCDHKDCCWYNIQIVAVQDYHNIAEEYKIYYTYVPVHEEYRYMCKFCRAIPKVMGRWDMGVVGK